MSVRIRLSRGGSKKRPFYKIVVADQRAPRDGSFIEKLGTFNPLLPKDHAERLVLDVEKAKSWLAKGAQPTERMQKMLAILGLCSAPVIHDQPKKSAPKAKAVARLQEKEEKAKAAAEAAAAAKAEAESSAE
ncbi:MAG: 30S ribosomal protein S16 [Alphaproteobacteria bacterium]|nr:30S ribosomal protein S16 [Alphaproteobacteria bacterium]